MKDDTMFLVYGVAFMFVAAVVAALLAYFYLREKKKSARKKPYAKLKIPPIAQHAKTEESGKIPPIPPDVPRTLGTVKIIAEEKPDWIINIIRKWLRQK